MATYLESQFSLPPTWSAQQHLWPAKGDSAVHDSVTARITSLSAQERVPRISYFARAPKPLNHHHHPARPPWPLDSGSSSSQHRTSCPQHLDHQCPKKACARKQSPPRSSAPAIAPHSHPQSPLSPPRESGTQSARSPTEGTTIVSIATLRHQSSTRERIQHQIQPSPQPLDSNIHLQYHEHRSSEAPANTVNHQRLDAQSAPQHKPSHNTTNSP